MVERAHRTAEAPPVGPGGRVTYLAYRAAASVAAALPESGLSVVPQVAGWAATPLLGRRGRMLARHAHRANGPGLAPPMARRAVRMAVASYVRYWLESLRLPATDPAVVDARFSIEGLEHIVQATGAGRGAILALPHLGGWDVGGSWFVRHGFPLTVVVEEVEPPELFEWFAGLRRSWGMNVVALGRSAGTRVLRALRANEVVALLCDRDLAGGGVEVDFFGERTTLPGGPAALALRTGAALLPTAVYFAGRGHHAVVRPPLAVERTGRRRDDVAALTQVLAHSLEDLIRAAPEQWHLMQPNWPSDLRVLEPARRVWPLSRRAPAAATPPARHRPTTMSTVPGVRP